MRRETVGGQDLFGFSAELADDEGSYPTECRKWCGPGSDGRAHYPFYFPTSALTAATMSAGWMR